MPTLCFYYLSTLCLAYKIMAYNDAQQQEHQKINTFHIYAWFPQLIVSGITFPLNSKA